MLHLHALLYQREFLSTPSARRATQTGQLRVLGLDISIHALREEGDAFRCLFRTFSVDFYPRPPRGGRPCQGRTGAGGLYHFYPRPPRGGRLSLSFWYYFGRGFLSTPSARRATHRSGRRKRRLGISIHALREEGDSILFDFEQLLQQFLSTPSARRATFPWFGSSCRTTDFYPRPPRGGRPAHPSDREQVSQISIHALREEGDVLGSAAGAAGGEFLSTPSARRATTVSARPQLWGFYFYPRPPRGGRPSGSRCRP